MADKLTRELLNNTLNMSTSIEEERKFRGFGKIAGAKTEIGISEDYERRRVRNTFMEMVCNFLLQNIISEILN